MSQPRSEPSGSSRQAAQAASKSSGAPIEESKSSTGLGSGGKIRKNRSNRSERTGNSKQSSPRKWWCFTVNNPDMADVKAKIQEFQSSLVSVGACQEEVGDSGTHHVQGCIGFKVKKRFSALVAGYPGWHWEPTKAKDKQVALEYCVKEESRKAGGFSWVFGWVVRATVQLCSEDDLYGWQVEAYAKLNEPVDPRRIYWYWSQYGGLGKTTFAKTIYDNQSLVAVVGGKKNDMLNGIVAFHERQKDWPRTVVVNVSNSCGDKVSYDGLESIKDGFFYSGKYEGAMVRMNSPKVFVLANMAPREGAWSSGRCEPVNVDKKGESAAAKAAREEASGQFYFGDEGGAEYRL